MKVAIIFGGASAERDVSIASGAQVFKALKARGHEVIAIDTATGILNQEEEKIFLESTVKETVPVIKSSSVGEGLSKFILSKKLEEIDICFLALHGGAGEDGRIQGYLDVCGIPYTGSTHMPCCYAMDKDVSKLLFRTNGVPTADWLMAPASIEEVEKKLGLPVVVKPSREGSTVGLTVVKTPDTYNEAIEFALKYDSEVVIEKFIPGREFTVGVLEDQALGVGEIIPKFSEIFDYKSKYQKGGAEEIFPAKISDEQTEQLRTFALKAHKALRMEGYSRVDFRMDPEGKIWCLEVNALPGMTGTSLLPQSAAVMGISFPDLCERICAIAIERCHRKK
ncbi:MAG: D-alanine--D-alanine ligase [Spirochaetaceae bacterium]|nr:D-alanine--D-alanine ligase [Spirochaetaceae bacterium]